MKLMKLDKEEMKKAITIAITIVLLVAVIILARYSYNLGKVNTCEQNNGTLYTDGSCKITPEDVGTICLELNTENIQTDQPKEQEYDIGFGG